MEIISTVILVCVLVGLSATFSGLNIALMALHLPELRRQAKLGNRKAKVVYPLRKNAHLTLTSILIGNVGAASATALFLGESAGSGLLAGVLSTLLLVIFGELLPQALFIRNSLTICAYLAPLLRLTIFVTYPIAKPLQITLDKLLGEHNDRQLHTRHELGLIISEHADETNSELDDDEVDIIRGALQLSEKKTLDIMTPIKEVYWLTPDTTIDADQIDEIKNNNWSRIPIFNRNLSRFFGTLRMKDLIDIDFDEESREVRDMPLFPVDPVGSRTALDTLLRKFIKSRTHLIPVEKDDRIIGIVTIEDVFEEIIGQEIIDESDHKLNRGDD
jgi:metal transporter CNNM